MEVCIRKLVYDDCKTVEEMADAKLKATNTNEGVFTDGTGLVFANFMLPDNIYGSENMQSFGYFDSNGELLGILGLRCLPNQPAWILSFIVTSIKIKNSVEVIKELMSFAINFQEQQGRFQWFVISKLDKFKAWQKLFKGARSTYHHFVYGRIPANSMPKWLSMLQLSGNKLFPYDTNISMYVSKKLCTSNDPDNVNAVVNEIDVTFL